MSEPVARADRVRLVKAIVAEFAILCVLKNSDTLTHLIDSGCDEEAFERSNGEMEEKVKAHNEQRPEWRAGRKSEDSKQSKAL